MGIRSTGGGLCILPRFCPGQESAFASARQPGLPEVFRGVCSPPCSLSAPCPLSLIQPTGWGQSCPAGSVLGSSRLASGWEAILEGRPGTAADENQVEATGSHPALGLLWAYPELVPTQRGSWLQAYTPEGPLLHQCARPLVPKGPAGCFHRVIKHQHSRGRQRQLPGCR